MLVNIWVTFAPLILSSGTVHFMARAYAQRNPYLSAICAIAFWCLCDSCTGLALLGFVHSLQDRRDHVESNEYFSGPVIIGISCIVLLQILRLLSSIAIVMRAFNASIVLNAINFVVHYVIIGVVLTETLDDGVALSISIMFVTGSIWICWALWFSISFSLFTQRSLAKRVADHVVAQWRTDAIYGAGSKEAIQIANFRKRVAAT